MFLDKTYKPVICINSPESRDKLNMTEFFYAYGRPGTSLSISFFISLAPMHCKIGLLPAELSSLIYHPAESMKTGRHNASSAPSYSPNCKHLYNKQRSH